MIINFRGYDKKLSIKCDICHFSDLQFFSDEKRAKLDYEHIDKERSEDIDATTDSRRENVNL